MNRDAAQPPHAAARELTETRARARLGGVFYVPAAALVFGVRGFDAIGVAAIVLFAIFAFARVAPLPSFARATPERGIRWTWCVVLASIVAWGALAGSLATIEPTAPATTVALMCSVAFSTAMAHSFAMRPRLAMIAIAVLLVPGLIAFVRSETMHGLGIVIGIYLAYALLVVVRSHREYVTRLGLEDELRDQRDRYEHQSTHDALTGLANRRRFEAALQSIVASPGEHAALALLVVDIDHFKRINDHWGHAAGDEALRAFAERLRTTFTRPGATVARIGGEEFGVLLPGATAGEAIAFGERLRHALAVPIHVGGTDVPITCSIGIAALPAADRVAPDDLLRAADAALYRAKQAGRDRICAAE